MPAFEDIPGEPRQLTAMRQEWYAIGRGNCVLTAAGEDFRNLATSAKDAPVFVQTALEEIRRILAHASEELLVYQNQKKGEGANA